LQDYKDAIKRRLSKITNFSTVEIPEHLKFKDPLPICCVIESPFPQNHHVTLVWHEGSQGTIVIGSTVPKINVKGQNLSTLEINIGRGANAKLVVLNSFSDDVEATPMVRARVSQNSNLNMMIVNLFNGKLHQSDYEIHVDAGCNVSLNILSFAREKELIHDSYRVKIMGEKSNAFINIRGISKKGSCQRHTALIEAGISSDGSRGLADTAGFLLDNDACFEVLPSLIVKNENIFLDHQAYVGHIPEETIEYLRTRGFEKEEAIFLIVHSLLTPLKVDLPRRFQREIEKLARLLVGGIK
jgi:Fe-S cluster assembly scaffold protein SufB